MTRECTASTYPHLPLRQPDIFERSEAMADELALLASNILEASIRFAESRQGRMLGGMRSACIDLQNYRAQYLAMVASIERVIEAESRGK